MHGHTHIYSHTRIDTCTPTCTHTYTPHTQTHLLQPIQKYIGANKRPYNHPSGPHPPSAPPPSYPLATPAYAGVCASPSPAVDEVSCVCVWVFSLNCICDCMCACTRVCVCVSRNAWVTVCVRARVFVLCVECKADFIMQCRYFKLCMFLFRCICRHVSTWCMFVCVFGCLLSL